MKIAHKTKTMKSNLFLLLAAIIWGFAFVAQSIGMKYVGPFTYNGVRFALGSLSLVPLILLYSKRDKVNENKGNELKKVLQAGCVAGLFLFAGASFQQVGMLYTTAGKAAFITGLYIVLVPIFGLIFKEYISFTTGAGAIIAIVGLYYLCVDNQLMISKGDWIELAGSFFWAFHILIIGHFTRKVDALKLSCIQFAVCAVLSLGTAMFVENISTVTLWQAAIPILYGGVCSVGIAYTLQVVGQKNAHPAHAAIILSLESVFAAIGSAWLLHEVFQIRKIIGCVLMLAGMLLSQANSIKKNRIAD